MLYHKLNTEVSMLQPISKQKNGRRGISIIRGSAMVSNAKDATSQSIAGERGRKYIPKRIRIPHIPAHLFYSFGDK